jgi:hypothetical protein
VSRASGSVALLACLAAAATSAVDRADPPPARIVNGTPSSAFPAVGILLAEGQFCSATLIGCETVLTAAHCLCPDNADTFAQCQRGGGPNPDDVFFLPQSAPMAIARSIAIHQDYNFGRGGDIAVIKLQQPVTGITPMAFNSSAKPALGTAGTIVGYGRIGGDPGALPEVGIKRVASVVSARCPGPSNGEPGIPAENHDCIDILDGDDAGTCQGDSGGPLLIDQGAGDVVAGVTSGGSTERDVLDCLPDSVSFFTDVFRYRAFVTTQLGEDSGPCGNLPPAGAPGTTLQTVSGRLAEPGARFQTTVEVPPDVEALRVNMNGDFLTAAGFNDFDLFVNFGPPASFATSVCRDTNGVAYGACEIVNPMAGTWHVTVESLIGAGDFQLLTRLFGVDAINGCIGDCDGNGMVRIDELIRSVTIALGSSIGQCAAIDVDLDGTARINELVAAVNAALDGCA